MITRHLLEIENWAGGYEREALFSSLEMAKHHGQEHFPQNKWRIKRGEQIVYDYDPFAVIAAEAALEIHRFQETARWRQIFADRAAEEVRRRQERERWATSYVPVALLWPDPDEVGYHRRNPLEERVNWLKEGF